MKWINVIIGVPITIIAITISDTWLSGWISMAIYNLAMDLYQIHKLEKNTTNG